MGFLKKLLSFGTIIVAVICTKVFTPEVVNMVKDYTNIQSTLSESFYKMFNETSILDKMDLSMIQNMLDVENMNQSIKDYIVNNLSDMILNVLCGIGVFILTIILFKLIIKILDFVDIIPIVGQLNKILGAVLGLFESLLIVSIVFALLKVLSQLPPVAELITNNIENTFLLSYLYNNNIIFTIFNSLVS